MTGAPVIWTSDEAARATAGQVRAPWSATGVSIDTRTLIDGDLFLALQGPNFDGHDYVMESFARGAAAAVVTRSPHDLPAGAPLLVVNETEKALRALAGEARARSEAQICVITGSVGKTGVKEALRKVLSAQGRTVASEGNLNNHWGLPLSLARMARGTAYGVFEIGMNHAGELTPLSRLARPHVAVVTTVEAVHKAHFASLEAIADAKAEIFAGIEPGGTAVLNLDNVAYRRLRAAAEAAGAATIVGFGRDARADVRLLDAVVKATGSRVKASAHGAVLEYFIGAPGSHWVTNSLCVIAAAAALGADVSRAAAALADFAVPAGRGKSTTVRIPGGAFELIDESYNASPVAMAAAFEVLGRAATGPGGRRIAVLGDMLELGDDADALHADLARPLVANAIELVFTAGPAMARLAEALPAAMRGGHAEDSARLAPVVAAAVGSGDVVTVKGSAGSRMGVIVRALRAREQAFDADRPRAGNGG